MENVIKTLRDLLIKHQNSPSIQVSQLTMIIQGFVDAAVNGMIINIYFFCELCFYFFFLFHHFRWNCKI